MGRTTPVPGEWQRHPFEENAEQNRNYSLRTDDIEGARPNYHRRFATTRCTDPNNPVYTLPEIEVKESPMLPQRRVTNLVDDIPGARAKPLPTSAPRDVMKTIPVDTSFAKTRIKSRTTPMHDSMAPIEAAKAGKLSLRTTVSDPLAPVYTIYGDDHGPPDGASSKPMIKDETLARPMLSLTTHDIEGSHADASLEKFRKFATRNTNNTHDIKGARPRNFEKFPTEAQNDLNEHKRRSKMTSDSPITHSATAPVKPRHTQSPAPWAKPSSEMEHTTGRKHIEPPQKNAEDPSTIFDDTQPPVFRSCKGTRKIVAPSPDELKTWQNSQKMDTFLNLPGPPAGTPSIRQFVPVGPSAQSDMQQTFSRNDNIATTRNVSDTASSQQMASTVGRRAQSARQRQTYRSNSKIEHERPWSGAAINSTFGGRRQVMATASQRQTLVSVPGPARKPPTSISFKSPSVQTQRAAQDREAEIAAVRALR